MEPIIFFDTEIDSSEKVCDIGAYLNETNKFHEGSIPQFIKFTQKANYLAGHNVFAHDLKYLQDLFRATDIQKDHIIDTLFLSPLLFPKTPYHALLKDDKIISDDINNPLNDSVKSKDLFYDEIAAWQELDAIRQQIYIALLKGHEGFEGFFNYLGLYEQQSSLRNRFLNIYRKEPKQNVRIDETSKLADLIKDHYHGSICENANLELLIERYPVEFAYTLALIGTQSRYSITPPWVAKKFTEVHTVMYLLRNHRCVRGCDFCNQHFDPLHGLKKYFGFDQYRSYGGEALQENAVQYALDNQSLLAVFPTGGGKSITFQVPALMQGESVKGLTVVISPLQSLMKDQVDNLEDRDITDAVTINGLLDPIERAKAVERVENGTAAMLYISPESLRSRTIEKLLLGRNVVRFVIDEAHCFSSWGQDFRVDYLYIGDFIKRLMDQKQMTEPIPVSCFTATAKQNVIEDICLYFQEKLDLELKVLSASVGRTNLSYKVIKKDSEEDKYLTLRDLIIEKKCPTIVYVSRTGKAAELAKRLSDDGIDTLAYHGKMEKQEKSANQEAFIAGEVQVMVATSAFGMGVDKKDVGLVVHFQISDSLENYIQEAGRAGRDQNIEAECFVLFNEEDLNKHFILLNQTKLSIQEIQQVWKAIKDVTRLRHTISQSALEIARLAGWDDSVMDIETRVKTAIAALEESGYVKRGQNMPRIYASSITVGSVQEAIEMINRSHQFAERQKIQAVRIIKKLISQRSRYANVDEAAESRVDYISDHLGIVKEEVIEVIQLLRNVGILSDNTDLSAFLKTSRNQNVAGQKLSEYAQIERFLLSFLSEEENTFQIKQINEEAEAVGITKVSPNMIKTILNIWSIKHWAKRQINPYDKNHVTISMLSSKKEIQNKISRRHEIAQWITEYLVIDGLNRHKPALLA